MQTAKNKVKNLRTAFRRELSSRTQKKKKKKKKIAPSPIKKSQWFDYDLLQFFEELEIASPRYFSQLLLTAVMAQKFITFNFQSYK